MEFLLAFFPICYAISMVFAILEGKTPLHALLKGGKYFLAIVGGTIMCCVVIYIIQP